MPKYTVVSRTDGAQRIMQDGKFYFSIGVYTNTPHFKVQEIALKVANALNEVASKPVEHYMYGVYCLNDVKSCGLVELTEEQYMTQLSQAHKTWRCPQCRAEAQWDDNSKVCE